jgi:hypothetical protein
MDRQNSGSNNQIRWIRPEEFNRRDPQAAQPNVLAMVPIRWEPGPIIA